MFLVNWFERLTTTPISGPPRLPEDLEREIFLLAALDDAQGTSIPSFLRVAKRTRLWLEPVLYRVMLLLDYRDNAKFIAHRLKTKPAQIWHDGPRHLFLALGDESTNVPVMLDLLVKCTELRNITFYPPDDHPRAFLPALDGMNALGKLSTELGALFDNSIASIDLSRSGFARITHLMLFDDLPSVSAADAEHLAGQLTLLPELTHLALAGGVEQHLLLTILAALSDERLRVLVNRRTDTRRRSVQMLYEDELSGVTDVRFVIMPFGLWVREWEQAARGMKDEFWVEAEGFVEDKRKRRIPADQFWTDASMTV
ncbi:hypothetical protein HMN09_01001500 [Mycena chlorophos]|uniref:Uncharacterized protein n=1 Tax=Mycena chlorophos TaxID=658473 RepID=A0A8H6SHY0_MYCCL|nr:hypothetical protein HMN09_01001500 [Mycena chlorophos]